MKALNLQMMAVEIEKVIAEYAGNEIEAMRKVGGDKLSNELLATVASMFAGRSIAMIHLWTGEPINEARQRVVDTMDFHTKTILRKAMNQIGGVDGDRD